MWTCWTPVRSSGFPCDYPDRRVRLEVFEVTGWCGRPHGREGQAIEWLAPQELRRRKLVKGAVPILGAIDLPSLYLVTPRAGERLRGAAPGPARSGGPPRSAQGEVPAARSAPSPRAGRAAELAERSGARLFLNGDPETARAGPAPMARTSRAEPSRVSTNAPPWPGFGLAASCHDARELSRARTLGADFAVLSPVRATPGHPDARPIGWEGFSRLVEPVDFPVFALGGLGARRSLRRVGRGGGRGSRPSVDSGPGTARHCGYNPRPRLPPLPSGAAPGMTFVVTEQCIKCKYTDCVEVCPVDCFHEGPNMLVIDPDECIDCTLCEPECPVEAILSEDDLTEEQQPYLELNEELSRLWPVLTEKKDGPEDAADWEWVEGKLQYLER